MLSSVIVVVDGCRCRCWNAANYSFILMRGRKIGYHGRRESNPGPERLKPRALTISLSCPLLSVV